MGAVVEEASYTQLDWVTGGGSLELVPLSESPALVSAEELYTAIATAPADTAFNPQSQVPVPLSWDALDL